MAIVTAILVIGFGAMAFFVTPARVTVSSGVETTTWMTPIPMIIFPLAIIILLAVGFALTPLIRNTLKMGSIYAVTDRRALIIAGKSVQSYGEKDIQFIERRMRGENTGDIIFKREPHSHMGYYGGSVLASRAGTNDIGFFGIRNVREVEALMLETFRPDQVYAKRKHSEMDEDFFEDDDVYANMDESAHSE
jgi:hypothetical protein